MADYQQLLATLAADPQNSAALQALERLAAVPGDHGGLGEPAGASALDEARKVHRDRGELELVARLFDVELAAASDRSRKAWLLSEKGKLLFEELLNEDDAVECFRRALELSPEDAESQEMLARIELESGNWERFVKKYLDEAKASTDRGLTTSMYLSAAETYARYRPDAQEV